MRKLNFYGRVCLKEEMYIKIEFILAGELNLQVMEFDNKGSGISKNNRI